jgi:hypothetical protein
MGRRTVKLLKGCGLLICGGREYLSGGTAGLLFYSLLKRLKAERLAKEFELAAE